MAQSTRVSFKTIEPTALVKLLTQMEIPTRETGLTIRLKALVSTCTYQEQSTTANGTWISSTGMARSTGQTVPFILETMLTVLKKVKGS